MKSPPSPPEGAVPDGGPYVAAKAADAAVRQALVEGHCQILGFLRRRLGSADQAEDVLQAFMLRALERSAELRDARAVRGWLTRILATTIVDHQRRSSRKRKREVEMNAGDLEPFPIEADSELDEAICNCLYKLLPTLKPEYAEVIWRVDLLEEPRERVAASLGVTLNNVTVRLHRGRQALKLRLEEMCFGCPSTDSSIADARRPSAAADGVRNGRRSCNENGAAASFSVRRAEAPRWAGLVAGHSRRSR